MRADDNGRPRFVQNNCAPEGWLGIQVVEKVVEIFSTIGFSKYDHTRNPTTPAHSPHSLPLPRVPARQHPTLSSQLDVYHPGTEVQYMGTIHGHHSYCRLLGEGEWVPVLALITGNCNNSPPRPPPLPSAPQM